MRKLLVDIKGGNIMYYGYPNYGYGYGNSCGCSGGNVGYIYPNYGCGNSNYAIIIVLFILLVIIIGTRWGR